MPLNFPATPTTGQSYSFGGTTWTYNGTGWAVSAGELSVTSAGGDLTGSWPNPTIANSSVTADKLGSTLAGQLGVSQTGTNRSVTVTQTAEITTTALATVVTSSNLTVAANGLLRIVLSCELKNSSTTTTFVQAEIDTGGGTWLSLASTGWASQWSDGSSQYFNSSTGRPSVSGTTYKRVNFIGFTSSNFQTSSNAAALRVRYEPNAGTAFLRNLTATMTYIAV